MESFERKYHALCLPWIDGKGFLPIMMIKYAVEGALGKVVGLTIDQIKSNSSPIPSRARSKYIAT